MQLVIQVGQARTIILLPPLYDCDLDLFSYWRAPNLFESTFDCPVIFPGRQQNASPLLLMLPTHYGAVVRIMEKKMEATIAGHIGFRVQEA